MYAAADVSKESTIFIFKCEEIKMFLDFLTFEDEGGIFLRNVGNLLPNGSGVPRNFVWGGGVQKIQLRTEDREDGIWGR
jgi:hypothetical protein